jgi:hypothetical protein
MEGTPISKAKIASHDVERRKDVEKRKIEKKIKSLS